MPRRAKQKVTDTLVEVLHARHPAYRFAPLPEGGRDRHEVEARQSNGAQRGRTGAHGASWRPPFGIEHPKTEGPPSGSVTTLIVGGGVRGPAGLSPRCPLTTGTVR